MQTDFYYILEKLVILKEPALYERAKKIELGLIETPKTALIRLFPGDPNYPKPATGFKFKQDFSAVNILVDVEEYKIYKDEVLFGGHWYPVMSVNPTDLTQIPIETSQK